MQLTLNRSSLIDACTVQKISTIDMTRLLTWSSVEDTLDTVRSKRENAITHSWLSWNTSGNNYDVCAREDVLEALIWGKETLDLRGGRDMRQVGGNSWGINDIVEAELDSNQ